MSFWQTEEHSGVWYQDYAARSPSVSGVAINWTDPSLSPPKKRWKEVIARDSSEVREDSAPRFDHYKDGTPIRERVYYNDFGPDLSPNDWKVQTGNRPGAQLYPMKRLKKLRSGWDFNLDGFQHIGLLPDLIQDMRNVGVQWEQIEPLFHGSNDLIDTWSRSVAIGNDHP